MEYTAPHALFRPGDPVAGALLQTVQVHCHELKAVSMHGGRAAQWGKPRHPDCRHSLVQYCIHFLCLQDSVLSKCCDAHIYLGQGSYVSFQRWQSAFVSSVGLRTAPGALLRGVVKALLGRY